MEHIVSVWALALFSAVLAGSSLGSIGDQDPKFRFCVEECQTAGCINGTCFETCMPTALSDDSQLWPGLSSWKIWDCAGECKYQCMMRREYQRHLEGQVPVQYHGKWPFTRLLRLQEPASVAFSIANLAMHLKGWMSFLSLVFHKLPQKRQGRKSPFYEYASLWIIYGLLAINSWIWSTIFHSRDLPITERLDYLSAVAVIGYTLIITIIRTLDLRVEAARVMVASPIIAFVATHMLYLTLYKFDYGLNMKVCVVMGVLQLFMWTVWGWWTQHLARFKLWFVVMAGGAAMLLEIFDFPPIWGLFDAHSIWHAVTIPLTYLWWGFIKDDAVFRTNYLTNAAAKGSEGPKKVR